MGEPRGTFKVSSPNVSPRIEIVLLRLFHDVVSIEARRSEEVLPSKETLSTDDTYSLTGWMMGTVSDLSLNMPAMVFMIAFDLSMLSLFVCH